MKVKNESQANLVKMFVGEWLLTFSVSPIRLNVRPIVFVVFLLKTAGPSRRNNSRLGIFEFFLSNSKTLNFKLRLLTRLQEKNPTNSAFFKIDVLNFYVIPILL